MKTVEAALGRLCEQRLGDWEVIPSLASPPPSPSPPPSFLLLDLLVSIISI